MVEADTTEGFIEDDQDVFDIESSNLDDSTHAEVIALYADAQDNIRFSKNLQWRAMSGAIILFVLLVLSCRLTDSGTNFVNSVICVSFSFPRDQFTHCDLSTLARNGTRKDKGIGEQTF